MISSILLLQTVTANADSTLSKISISTGDHIESIEYYVMGTWCALMFVFLYFLGRKYTFGDWTQQNPNPYQDETLGMPKGTMRGLITLTLLFFTVILELHAIRNPLIENWTDKYITSFQMVLAFYFGSQVVSNLSSKDLEKTIVTKSDPVKTDASAAKDKAAQPGC
jgi:hypothetical protein